MKSKHHAVLLIWGINTLLLALLAPRWWQGLIAGALIAAAAWTLSTKDASAASVSSIAPTSTAPKSDAAVRAVPSELVQGVVPAWRNNVQLARSQTQEAIDRLTQRFVGIHRRLGGAVSLAEGGKNGDVLQVIQNAATQLGGIAEALEQVLSTRDALLRKLETLGQHNEDIRQLAQEVEQIAGRTGVTDLFSDEQSWTELAARSADTGRQIIGKTKSVQQQIQTALASANQLDSDASRMMDDSRIVIDSVIADFRQSALKLSGTVGQLEEENREVDQEVCDILVNLQFQDRISQILDHVQLDMSKLVGLVEQAQPLPDRAAWLADLEKTYTTQEQRQIHAGQQADKSMQSQVDFF
ncbi:chemotaxis protein [Herbaspirillum rhizosphaerae]|uniref:chemotaxis protein n=1 Tax=Herbaspirillum rhizosphaerae TaxID=346179 RepID=UPI000B15E16B|nr:chemotaxis protein [Herbaspirillum rhizosphaerae]